MNFLEQFLEKHQKLMEEHNWTKYFDVDIMDNEIRVSGTKYVLNKVLD